MAEHYVTTLTVWEGQAWVTCRCGWLGVAEKQVTELWNSHRLVMEQAEKVQAAPKRLGFPADWRGPEGT